jgi:hypothetical protein
LEEIYIWLGDNISEKGVVNFGINLR